MSGLSAKRRALMRRALLRAVAPAAFMAGMPPPPVSQKAWIVYTCSKILDAKEVAGHG